LKILKKNFELFKSKAFEVERSNPTPIPPTIEEQQRGHVQAQVQVVVDPVLSQLHERDTNALIIEEANKSWKELESDLIGLQEIYKDLAIEVNTQGEVLTQVEDNIHTADVNVEIAKRELVQADKLQSKSRKKILILILVICCCAGTAALAILLTLYFVRVI